MNKPTPTTRHGQRAAGIESITVPVPACLKRQLEAMAAQDHRTLAAFLRIRFADLVRRSGAARRGAAERVAA